MMNNIQQDVSFPIMEQFYTLQGEGHYAGRAAYFIRLGGCDVGCVWCDVKESWDATIHQQQTVAEIVAEISTFPTDFVVITGGEPAMYDLTPLTDALHAKNYEVAIETSGCYDLKGNIDWYCFSPKKFKAPVADAYAKANELKVVVFHKSDIKWAEEHAKLVNENCILYLQPEWSKLEQNLPLIIDYIKDNPKWRMSLQTHKYMNIP
ncbi:MAG TPA: 7-carboxy-7-deazaguanine synthase QueE [Crocinitomicaceae bacterium]|nr:7-carboxy-7-deazaguanine synthase QueE [Crocinitomicaceae bacterium]